MRVAQDGELENELELSLRIVKVGLASQLRGSSHFLVSVQGDPPT